MPINPCSERRAAHGCRGWRGGTLAAVALLAWAATAHPAMAAPAAPALNEAPASAAPFATVGDAVITRQEFDNALAQATRGKFYHGKPPEGAVAQLQRDVAQSLVDELLLAKEAKRRKLQPDHVAISQTIQGYEERYRTSAQWQANRARLLPGLQARLERDSLLEQLTRQVKQAGEPTPAQREQYWQSHEDKL